MSRSRPGRDWKRLKQRRLRVFDGPIIDVAIGLIFFYVVLSLICSAILELVASMLGLRARNLARGIDNLLGGGYSKKLYGHPLIKHLAMHGKKPSYVRPSIFAAALLDVVGRSWDEDEAATLSAGQVRAALERMDRNEPVRSALLALGRSSEESLDEMREAVADWYDEAMEPGGQLVRAACEVDSRFRESHFSLGREQVRYYRNGRLHGPQIAV